MNSKRGRKAMRRQTSVITTHLLPIDEYITKFLRMRDAVSRILFVTGPSLSS